MTGNRKRTLLLGSAGLAITLVVGLFVVPKALAASCFTDTESHWAETYICWLFNNGISSGYPDGSFRPENTVSRGEMAVFLQQVAGQGSAGPVANADLLDGLDSTYFAPQSALDSHTHLIAQANETSQTISGAFTEVLNVTLNIPDKCTGLFFIDKWNVLVTASGYVYAAASSLARLGVSIDDASTIQSGTLTNASLGPGDDERKPYSVNWVFTNVGSGSHDFRLLADKFSGADYEAFWSRLIVQTMGYSCGFLIILEPEQSNPDDVDMQP